jgi:flagellar biosynthesis/type III secretory pathway protein FliH
VPEAFRSLASIFALREATPQKPPPARPRMSQSAGAASDAGGLDASAPRGAVADETRPSAAAVLVDERISDLLDVFVADLSRLRARAAERLEASAETVLADLATRVLARELSVAPPDIERLVSEALDEFSSETQCVVRVSSSDAERLGTRWPLQIDAKMQPGDFAVEVDDGRFEVSLQTRLDGMLASHRLTL